MMKESERLAIREITRRLNESNTAKQFGFLFREVGPGRVVVGMRVSKRHLQVHGVVHGGILAALADTAGGMAVYLTAAAGIARGYRGDEDQLSGGRGAGRSCGGGGTRAAGRNLAVVDCDLFDHTRRIVAKALMTFAIISRGRKARKAGPTRTGLVFPRAAPVLGGRYAASIKNVRWFRRWRLPRRPCTCT